jgi:hypothetical protein
MASTALDKLRRVFRRGADRHASGRERALGVNLIFRLRAWPSLPENGRTAEVYRILSVMSNRPVNRQWLLSRLELAPRQLDALLHQLVAQGSVEVIDPAQFARG